MTFEYDERREAARYFGAVMEERRKALGISRDELAEKSGVSKSSIDNYAVGRCEPMALAIVRIAAALKTTPNYMLDIDWKGMQWS